MLTLASRHPGGWEKMSEHSLLQNQDHENKSVCLGIFQLQAKGGAKELQLGSQLFNSRVSSFESAWTKTGGSSGRTGFQLPAVSLQQQRTS